MVKRIWFAVGVTAAIVGFGCSGGNSSASGPYSGPSCQGSGGAQTSNTACDQCVHAACANAAQCLQSDCSDYLACDCACQPNDSTCHTGCASKATSACHSCVVSLTQCQETSCTSECHGGSAAQGSSSSSSSGGGGSGSSSGGASPGSCVPQPVRGSCYLAASNACAEYTGSGYAPDLATLEQSCMTAGGAFSTNGCPTDMRLGGSCVLLCGMPSEEVTYLYAGLASDTKSYCQAAGTSATYVP